LENIFWRKQLEKEILLWLNWLPIVIQIKEYSTKNPSMIKIIDKSRLDPTDHKKLEREIAVMKSLIHPYIIRLYEVN
jgi:serine/threonine protein kinase